MEPQWQLVILINSAYTPKIGKGVWQKSTASTWTIDHTTKDQISAIHVEKWECDKTFKRNIGHIPGVYTNSKIGSFEMNLRKYETGEGIYKICTNKN